MLAYGLTLKQDVFEFCLVQLVNFEELGRMSTKIFFVFCFFQEITFFAHLVGSGLNKLFQLKTQSCIFAKSLFNLEAETLALFTTEKREVSSANSLALVVTPRGSSLMSVRKNNGSRIEPCGTPAVTNFQTED